MKRYLRAIALVLTLCTLSGCGGVRSKNDNDSLAAAKQGDGIWLCVKQTKLDFDGEFESSVNIQYEPNKIIYEYSDDTHVVEFDDAGRVVSSYFLEQTRSNTTFTYTDSGFVIEIGVIGSEESKREEWKMAGVDEDGNTVWSLVLPDDLSGTGSLTIKVSEDGKLIDYNMLSILDPNDPMIEQDPAYFEYWYDEAGRSNIVGNWSYNEYGEIEGSGFDLADTSNPDDFGASLEYSTITYDSKGNLISIEYYDYEEAQTYRTECGYNDNGELVALSRDSSLISYEYDEKGLPKTETGLDYTYEYQYQFFPKGSLPYENYLKGMRYYYPVVVEDGSLNYLFDVDLSQLYGQYGYQLFMNFLKAGVITG